MKKIERQLNELRQREDERIGREKKRQREAEAIIKIARKLLDRGEMDAIAFIKFCGANDERGI